MMFFSKKRIYLLVLLGLVSALMLGVWIMSAANTRSAATRILSDCAADPNKPLCYSKHIESTLRAQGIPAAFDEMAIAYDSDPAFAGTCHSVTHELGKAAYEEFSRSGDTELTSKAWYCGYGFYHGFMDALVLETNDMQQARAFCEYVGENVPHPPAPEFAEGSCYHGIGHGVTDGTDPRLWGDPIAIVKPGLALCKSVTAGDEEWHMRCSSGVFNALGNMYFDPKYKLVHPTDPYALCRTATFSELDRGQCYSQMNTEAAYLARNDLRGIVKFTDAISDLDHRAIALHEAVSFYIQTLKRESRSIQPEEVSVCELPTRELSKSCVNGIVGGIVEFGSPGQQYIDILRLCGASGFPSGLRNYCYSSLQTLSPYYYAPEVSSKICRDIPAAYKDPVCVE